MLEGQPILIYEDNKSFNSRIISMETARKCLNKGCNSYLAYVINTTNEEKSIKDKEIIK